MVGSENGASFGWYVFRSNAADRYFKTFTNCGAELEIIQVLQLHHDLIQNAFPNDSFADVSDEKARYEFV